MPYENEASDNSMYAIFNTPLIEGFDEMLATHARKLNNFKVHGQFVTDDVVMGGKIGMPGPRKIHSVEPTIINYGNQVRYTTIVCYSIPETPADEAAEGKKQ